MIIAGKCNITALTPEWAVISTHDYKDEIDEDVEFKDLNVTIRHSAIASMVTELPSTLILRMNDGTAYICKNFDFDLDFNSYTKFVSWLLTSRVNES